MAVLHNLLNKQRRALRQMANDKDVDDKARINAHHIAGEIAMAVMNLMSHHLMN
jgi:hypothetical protein